MSDFNSSKNVTGIEKGPYSGNKLFFSEQKGYDIIFNLKKKALQARHPKTSIPTYVQKLTYLR